MILVMLKMMMVMVLMVVIMMMDHLSARDLTRQYLLGFAYV
jgi:hypothetical protein